MIVRVNKNTNYTTMANYHLKDRKLSLKAKGLLSVVLSLPDNWEYSISGLAAISKEKEASINTVLKELKANGYLVITKKMPNETKSGRIEYEWDFYEMPQVEKQEGKKQDTEKQRLEKQRLEKQRLENQGQLNTNILNTKEESTKEESTKEDIYISANEVFFDSLPAKPKKKFVPPTVEEVAEYCKERNNKVDPVAFVAYYASQNWKKANGRPVSDWKLCVVTWEKKEAKRHDPTKKAGNPFDDLLNEEGYT